MSAIPEEFVDRATRLSEDVTRPIAGSKKLYVEGSRADIRVPMREIGQADTPAAFGTRTAPPITVYDTSGPYSDPAVKIDLLKGLPALRRHWIEARDDSTRLPGLSSAYGRTRQTDTKLAHLRFEHICNPRRAKPGRCVTQMHYAKQGVITPEMEFIAIR